ncbi:hypothetical protein EVAR_19414_1 [Eumeta japonica]|uniref:Uncharacterized protein n=1 Tax=Eumeta variegata TaxID=151549 RepID=A0A4C1TRJ9_EUMVA|nr:hypothetical protein EVAR_19414_1 [Eumeta japonica]
MRHPPAAPPRPPRGGVMCLGATPPHCPLVRVTRLARDLASNEGRNIEPDTLLLLSRNSRNPSISMESIIVRCLLLSVELLRFWS